MRPLMPSMTALKAEVEVQAVARAVEVQAVARAAEVQAEVLAVREVAVALLVEPAVAGAARARGAPHLHGATRSYSTLMATASKPPAPVMAPSFCSTMMRMASRPAPAGSSPMMAGLCWTAMATAQSILAANCLAWTR